jgi:glucose-6-phosphate dehydrogenase assembly protein OpcA
MAISLGANIPIGNIDAELRKLWLADETNTRASLTNFAIYSERENSLEENTELIEAITAEQACRAINIHADPACKSASAKAWITAHCRIDPRGNKNICSEQISFDLCGPTGDLLRSIVFAHLDSDLPLVLWWQGDLNENFDERLYSRIDRLLVNSDRWEHPQRSFATLRRALEDTGGRLAIHDLSWSRSYHFRLAIANLFDDHAALARLGDIRSVVIFHEDGVPLAAKMLGTWIAAKLPSPDVDLKYSEAGEGANLTEIRLETVDACFTVRRGSGSRFLTTTIDCPEKSYQTLSPAGPEHRSELIADLMARAGSNSRYREILQDLKI